MNKKIILIAIITISLGLGIYSYIILPDMVTMQIDLQGNPSNTYPKILAIILPMLLSIGGVLDIIFQRKKKINI